MKISVVTAVWNSENTVRKAIESVAGQQYPLIEHLIVEGRSTDRSIEVIEEARHPRMHLISEPDDGIYDALNKGVQRCTGDIIGFVHSDDFLAHNSVLDLVAKAFEDPSVEAVFGDLEYVSQSDLNLVVRHWAAQPFSKRRIKLGWMPPHPTLYLRRSAYERLGGFDTSFEIAADYDFILRYFSNAQGKSVCISEVLYKMRLGGVSNRSLAKIYQKSKEDFRAIRGNRAGGILTLFWKNASKVGQFFHRNKVPSVSDVGT